MEHRKKEKQTTRELTVNSIRAMEGEGNERKFILSFSSEEPYERWWGTEILDHSEGAVDLTRLNEIGVLLYNHNRDRVIGKVNRAWIENLRGMAEVEFDSDEDADLIYQKVKNTENHFRRLSDRFMGGSNAKQAVGRWQVHRTGRHRKKVDTLRNQYRERACGPNGRCRQGTGR